MGNEFKGQTSHSAEYFGDTRDYWWNHDFIRLMAVRWGLDRVRDALDVGCGVGHWGMLIGSVLPGDARVTGIDRDPLWVEKARERAAARGLSDRFHYQVGLAEKLPFADDAFDLVTCQTVLIHARDPGATLAEMIRVTRPGGLVAVAEPNNIAGALMFDTTSFDAPIEEIVTMVRLQLTCERGKAALGEGHNSAGERIPGLFAAHGLADVKVHMNDKTSAMLPPYASPAERALVEEMLDFSQRDFGIWSHADTRRFYLAGGGEEAAFDAAWAMALDRRNRAAEAIRKGTYATAGGGVVYLISGRKPPVIDSSRPPAA
jgi:SAM-dependent methyltransferase